MSLTKIPDSMLSSDKLDHAFIQEMFPSSLIINLDKMTVGDIVISRNPIKLGTVTLG